MNSYNHYAYGAVCQWLFEAVAGLRPDEKEPGFSHVIFEPAIIPSLSPVKAAHDSAAGRIEAEWQLEQGKVRYAILVPDGARGTVVLPADATEIEIDGIAKAADGKIGIAVGSGRHIATFRLAAA
jgi:alpha-L-rhamnosidase